jgi:hypothetical protein
MSETRAPRAFATFLPIVLVLVLIAAVWLDLRRRTDALAERVAAAAEAQEQVARAVQLFRFERGSQGLGVAALIEQLRYWAPLLGLATTPKAELPRIQQRVDDILTAFGDIGPSAFDPLLRTFHAATPGSDDELIRWVLRAMSAVDQERSEDVLVACARGIDFPVSGPIRVHAAGRLLELDKPKAAQLMSEIVGYESAGGIDLHRMPPELRQKLTGSKVAPQPLRMFFNFIDILAASGAVDVEDKLIMAASRPDQDRMTVQTCVVHLGNLQSARAVKTIKRLYEAPPEMAINPIFQNHCLDAIAKIEGAAACDYFRDLLRKGPDERVASKLKDLIKTHCP